MATDSEKGAAHIKLGERQSIEELTGGEIQKVPRGEHWHGGGRHSASEHEAEGGEARGVPQGLKEIAEERGDRADEEDVEAWRQGYRPGMAAEDAKRKGIDARTFISQEIEHHMEDKGMTQDRAVAAALSEARRGGYDVPREQEKD